MIALQLFVTRQVEVFDPAVITIAQIACRHDEQHHSRVGLPGRHDPDVLGVKTRKLVHDGIAGSRTGIAAAHGATADVELSPLPGHHQRSGVLRSRRRPPSSSSGEARVDGSIEPVMGAEDFSYVLEQIPGAMAFVGGRPADEDPATAPANHSNQVIFDEAAMAVGAATYVAVALRGLDAAPSS